MTPLLDLLRRAGSFLDARGLELVAQMAADAGGQVWMEKVSDDGRGCSVLIEDGAIAGVDSADDGGEVA